MPASLAGPDQVAILCRSGTEALACRARVAEEAQSLGIVLEGTWSRVDGRITGEAGIFVEGAVVYVRPAGGIVEIGMDGRETDRGVTPCGALGTLAERISTQPEVRAAFAFTFCEYLPGDVVESAAEYASGHLVVTETWAWADDAKLDILSGRDRDAYVWGEFPLSRMARRLGLAARPVRARWADNDAGRPGANAQPARTESVGVYLPVAFAKAARAEADARGVTVSGLFCEILSAFGKARLAALAREPEIDDVRMVKEVLACPEPVAELLRLAAVSADQSFSHVVRRAWLAHVR